MDKGMAAYLAVSAVICVGICKYCGLSKTAEVPKIITQTVESTEMTTQDVVDNNGKKFISMPVYAEYAFLDDFNIPHVIVKNNTEQIYGYSLSVKYYDDNKKEIENKNIDMQAVIPSGMSESPERFIPPVDGAKYIAAAVTAYSIKDKSIKIQPVYNDHLYTLQQLKKENKDAPCSLITIGRPEIIASHGESDLSDIRFSITNLSDRPVKNIEFLVAEYDANGKPVTTKPNGYIKENIRKLTWDNAGLIKDIPKTAASAMALNKNCAEVRVMVLHIDFEDRGVWSNPAALDWILSQE